MGRFTLEASLQSKALCVFNKKNCLSPLLDRHFALELLKRGNVAFLKEEVGVKFCFVLFCYAEKDKVIRFYSVRANKREDAALCCPEGGTTPLNTVHLIPGDIWKRIASRRSTKIGGKRNMLYSCALLSSEAPTQDADAVASPSPTRPCCWRKGGL